MKPRCHETVVDAFPPMFTRAANGHNAPMVRSRPLTPRTEAGPIDLDGALFEFLFETAESTPAPAIHWTDMPLPPRQDFGRKETAMAWETDPDQMPGEEGPQDPMPPGSGTPEQPTGGPPA